MEHLILIDGQSAAIQYDLETGLFRGKFLGFSGGADFYAADIAGLEEEGRRSLKAYLDICTEKGIDPYAKPAR